MLFAVCYDNFLWHPDSVITPSSELNSAPFENIKDIDPCRFWETTSKTGQYVKLDLSDTGSRKPCFVGVYKHNFTKDLTVTLETDTADDFSSPETTETFSLSDDYHDFSTTKRGFQKFGFLFEDVLAETEANKAWMKLKFTDAGNADNFFRIGILFFGSLISLNVSGRGYDKDIIKKYNDPSTVFYSIANQMYVRARKVGEIITVTVTAAGELTRLAVRRIIRQVGMNKPVFLMLNNEITDEVEESTQTYYGYFSSLPSMEEEAYYEKSASELELNSVTDYKFEFTEIT